MGKSISNKYFPFNSYSVVYMIINFAPIHFLTLCIVTPVLVRHIQKHLGEVTGESENNQDVKDVADGDNAKGALLFHYHIVHVFSPFCICLIKY